MNLVAFTVVMILSLLIDSSLAGRFDVNKLMGLNKHNVSSRKYTPSCNLPQQTGFCVPYENCKDPEFPANKVFNPDTVKVIIARQNACPQHKGTLFCCSRLFNTNSPEEVTESRIDVIKTTTQIPITTTFTATRAPITQQTTDQRQNIPLTIEEIIAHKNFPLFNNKKCGESTGLRIANGVATSINEYPWMALIKYMLRGGVERFMCGGSLIAEKYVLTAAHCITSLSSGTKVHSVRLGEYDLEKETDCEDFDEEEEPNCAEPVQNILVEKVIPHKGYSDSNFGNDIGILRLAAPAIRKDNVRPICLPFAQELLNLPDKLIVIGFGTTEKQVKSKVLLQADIPHYPLNECKAKFSRERITLTDNQFCAGAQGKVDACKGDSGGPVQFSGTLESKSRMIQFGIVSFGVNTCGVLENVPGIYTKVSAYLGWILDNMEP